MNGVWEVARTGVAKDPVVMVEVERVARDVLVLLTGVATVEGTEVGNTKPLVVRADVALVTAAILLDGAAVVVVGEDDVGPSEDEVGATWAWAAWYLAARILSRIFLFSLFRFLGWFW